MAINPKNPRFNDIPRFTIESGWHVDISLNYLETWVTRGVQQEGLDLDPDFQRPHVWTEAQQRAFMEFLLRGGRTGKDLYFNCPGWPNTLSNNDPYVVVDGKQRLTAALRFLRGELRVFAEAGHPGYLFSEFQDKSSLRFYTGFRWHVNSLSTRAEVLQWYLEFNSAGTPHTPEELERVRELLLQERGL